MGERPKRRQRSEGRPQGNEFMDVARQAFVRYVALEKWREIEDMRGTLGFDWTRAAREAGQFPGRGGYQALWIQRWQEHVTLEAAADAGNLFSAIEKAIAAAVQDEDEERKRRGARSLDEEPEYKAFVDAALEKLLREQAGQLESF